jgi:Fe-S cluster assembly protein SufD
LASAPPVLEAQPLPLDRSTAERFGLGRAEPEWLVASRTAAAARYTADAWPTGAEEEWRRFPLDGLPRGPLVGAAAETIYRAPRGVLTGDLALLARSEEAAVRPWISAAPGSYGTHTAFEALAAALWSAGSFCRIPAGLVADAPIQITRTWERGDGAALSRTIIVAERGSQATVVEELASDGDEPRLAIPALEIHLAQGASLRYVRIQRFGTEVWDLGPQRYVSDRDSEIASFNVIVGSGRSKISVESDMTGDGANVKLYGLVAADGTQRIDINSLQRVDGKGSNSDLLYLSALYGSSKAVFYGTIRVEPTSSGTGSYQECRNMLLSDKAGADPIPVLEILTNDVARCGHGATAGALEDTELFYVMSRGLTRGDAERLLVRGFFQRVIDHLPDAEVRDAILRALAPRIGRIAELDAA